MRLFFTCVYIAAIAVELGIRYPVETRRRGMRRVRRQVSPAEWAVLSLLFLGMFFLPLAYALTPWLDFADYGWPQPVGAALGGLGCGLMLLSLWLFWRAHRAWRRTGRPRWSCLRGTGW